MDEFRREKIRRISHEERSHDSYDIDEALHNGDGERDSQGVDSLAEQECSYSPDYTESRDYGGNGRMGRIDIEHMRDGQRHGYGRANYQGYEAPYQPVVLPSPLLVAREGGGEYTGKASCDQDKGNAYVEPIFHRIISLSY